jgi:membrane protease YdiL (CAAX protease family)
MGRFRRQGPVMSSIISVALVLALGVSAVVVAWIWPQRTGVLGQEYAGESVFMFDRLRLDMEYLTIDVEAGLIVPALTHGEVTGAVIFGLGISQLKLPPEFATELAATLGAAHVRDDFSVMYLPATYQSLLRLKTLCQAVPAAEASQAALAQDLLDFQSQDAGLLRLFPRPSPAAAPGRPTAVRIYSVSFGRMDYLEGPQIILDIAKPVPRRLSFSHPGLAAPAFPVLYDEPVLAVTTALYGLLGVLLWVLCFALTLHLKEPEWAVRAAGRGGGLPLSPTTLPGFEFASLRLPLTILVAYVGHGLVGGALFGREYPGYLVEAIAALSLAFVAHRQKVPGEHLGLTAKALSTGALSGLLVGFYAVVAGSFGYPGGLKAQDAGTLAFTVLRSVALVGPAREFLLRGVAQTALERYLGRTGAILLPAAVSGLAYLGASLVGYGLAGRALGALLLEGLMVVPATSALAGYLYMRTRSLAAPAIMTGLVDLLPRVLSF